MTNRLFAENGISVPEIISISLEDRILVEHYIKGKSVVDFILDIFKSEQLSERQKEYVYSLGKLIAKIHKLDITVGDCKPENFIAGDDGKFYIIDLEQGERHGDKVWDVAEFLYFSGHYWPEFTLGMQQFVKYFIEGYCAEGGKKILKEAGGLIYTRVFLPWTSLPVIQGISQILRTTCS